MLISSTNQPNIEISARVNIKLTGRHPLLTWKTFTIGASTADEGNLFQWVTTRWVKPFFLTLRCACCLSCIFRPWPQRRLILSSFILNSLVLFISLKLCMFLNTCIMSPWSRLYAKVARYNCSSLDLYGRSFSLGLAKLIFSFPSHILSKQVRQLFHYSLFLWLWLLQ